MAFDWNQFVAASLLKWLIGLQTVFESVMAASIDDGSTHSDGDPQKAEVPSDAAPTGDSGKESTPGSDSGGSRPLPAPNLSPKSHRRWDFGIDHTYEPPLEIRLERPLVAGGPVAFTVRLPAPPNGDRDDQAFFYRLAGGEVVGYFNRCTHITIPLDYDDGKFLDGQGFIMCRVHGARYELETGLRCFGPARTNLTRILVEEDGGTLRIMGWEKVR